MSHTKYDQADESKQTSTQKKMHESEGSHDCEMTVPKMSDLYIGV